MELKPPPVPPAGERPGQPFGGPGPKDGLIGSLLAALFLILFLLALFALPSHGQQAPAESLVKASSPGRVYLFETAAYTLANVLDGVVTVRNTGPALGCSEQPFPGGSREILGRYPGVAQYALVEGGIQAATQLLAWRLEHSPRRFNRLVGHALMAQGYFSHAQGFIHTLHPPHGGVR